MSHARVYKSIIKPGEILLMPQGTFHQCRNVTPCLSYSRFILDTVNLRAFWESSINRDAPEIMHEDVMWNSSCDLIEQLDTYVKEPRCEEVLIPPDDVIRKVDTLRSLRGILRAVAKRYESEAKNWRPEAGGGTQLCAQKAKAKRWMNLIRDVDETLHDFRYRHKSSNKPPFRSQSQRPSTKPSTMPLEQELRSLPRVKDPAVYLSKDASLDIGSEVNVNFLGRKIKGVVKQVEASMRAAFVHFDDFPCVYDEYVPFGSLQVPVSGEACVHLLPGNAKPGMAVVYNLGPQVRQGWCIFVCCFCSQ